MTLPRMRPEFCFDIRHSSCAPEKIISQREGVTEILAAPPPKQGCAGKRQEALLEVWNYAAVQRRRGARNVMGVAPRSVGRPELPQRAAKAMRVCARRGGDQRLRKPRAAR